MRRSKSSQQALMPVPAGPPSHPPSFRGAVIVAATPEPLGSPACRAADRGRGMPIDARFLSLPRRDLGISCRGGRPGAHSEPNSA